jgi:hypothetical protein
VFDHGYFVAGGKQDGFGPCRSKPRAVFAAFIEIEAHRSMFDGSDAVSAFFQFGYNLFDYRGLSGIRTTDDAQDWVWFMLSHVEPALSLWAPLQTARLVSAA